MQRIRGFVYCFDNIAVKKVAVGECRQPNDKVGVYIFHTSYKPGGIASIESGNAITQPALYSLAIGVVNIGFTDNAVF